GDHLIKARDVAFSDHQSDRGVAYRISSPVAPSDLDNVSPARSKIDGSSEKMRNMTSPHRLILAVSTVSDPIATLFIASQGHARGNPSWAAKDSTRLPTSATGSGTLPRARAELSSELE